MEKKQYQDKPENIQVLERIKKETDHDRTDVLELTTPSKLALHKFDVKEE